MAEILPFVVAGLSVVSGIAGAASSIAQGNAAASAAAENARVLSENARRMREAAERTEAQGRTAAERARRQGLILRGNTLAALAASGIDPQEGSPLELISEQARESEFQALQAKFEFDQRAWEMRTQAYDLSQRSLMTLRQGGQQRDAGYGAAIGQVVGGFGRAGANTFGLLEAKSTARSDGPSYGGALAERPD